MGLQEPVSTEALDVACMSQLWLLSAGFTTIFSALFCKLWRLNKLLASAKRFKRVQIEVKDVLYPFAILLVLNFTLLAVWTAVDPLRWVRGDLASYDTYGRVTKTAGSCACESQTNQTIFYVFFFLLNASALVIANWQSYLGRNYETEFNESANIAFSMLLLTEAAVLGLPVLFLVKNEAGSFFLVRTILIVITSVGVLLPIFLPKVSLRNKLKFDSKRSLKSGSSRLDGSSAELDASSGFLSIFRRRDADLTKVAAKVVQTLESQRSDSANSLRVAEVFETNAAVLGLPVLFLVKNDAGSFFLVRTILIVITSVGVLLPIFLPKVSLRNKLKFDSKRSLRSGSSRLVGSSAELDASSGFLSIFRRRDADSTKVPAEVVQTLESQRSDSASTLRVAEVFETSGELMDDSTGFAEVRKVKMRRVSFFAENTPAPPSV
ncbi:hypothetical protein MHU86_4638 [Fragilaria crotonensis]|nr:hypothetical protein MHU86_4638 [Fragilaria crotonensis]